MYLLRKNRTCEQAIHRYAADNDRIIDLQTVRLKKIDSLPDVSLGVVWFQDYYPMN